MSNEGIGNNPPKFNKFQEVVFPIHVYELKKFLPMSFMMLCILFIYTLIRDLKTTLLVDAAGATSVGAAKLLVIVFAFLSVIIFAKLVNKFDFKKVFYIIIIFFLSFFALFGFVLYPMAPYIHMSSETIQSLQSSVPVLKAFWPIIGNWSITLFYIISELWGSLVISALFWQLANQTTKKDEVKRFYAFFASVGNIGLILSGTFLKFLSRLAKSMTTTSDVFVISVRIQMIAVLIIGAILLSLYYYLNKYVFTDPRFYDADQIVVKKKKPKMGIGESLKFIFTSPYLLLISVLVIGYGISMALTECVWYEQMKLLVPDKNDYISKMATLSMITGVLTIAMSFIGTNILRRCKWRTAALITPSILFVGSILFFSTILYENHVGINASIFGISILNIAFAVGLVIDAFTKSVKYSLFDSTKQMAYLPLDPESKSKGQAAVEVIAGRLGKGGGATIQQILVAIMPLGTTMAGLSGIVGAIVLIVVGGWIASVFKLNTRYEKLIAENEAAANAK